MTDEDSPSRSEAIAQRFDRTDRWLLGLAGIAVAIYLVELRGGWKALGIQREYQVAALLIDAIFVVDLSLKCWLMGKSYVRSVWFVVDLLSALPILSSLALFPSAFEGLRVARGIRLFRMLRMLRTLRVLRSIRLFKFVKPPVEKSQERRAFERTLLWSVLVYTGFFLALMTVVYESAPHQGDVVSVSHSEVEGFVDVELRSADNKISKVTIDKQRLMRTSDEIEFYFVIGSVLGMLLIVVVARAQVPAVANDQVRTLLNVALPTQVAEYFLKKPEDYDHTVSMPATIVFGDIRGFTSAVEALGDDLPTLKTHLEAAMDAVVQVHGRYDLIVDKFIGDAVMSFRGGDLVSGEPEEHAWRVVKAAIESPRVLKALDDPHFQTMRIGGASADGALIGTFGTSNRLSYTVLGDRVNLAARLESASKPLGTSNLFCGKTRTLTADRDDIVWRSVGALRVEGKTESVDVHEAFFPDDPLEWLPRYEEAFAAYGRADIAAAREGFAEVDEMRPDGDGPSRFYLPTCDKLLRDGVPDDWTAGFALKK